MNNEQSNDRTEDFLRKYLDNYSDTPPESVWDGVASQLAPPVPPPRVWTQHHWMGVVIGILCLGLISQFWYFNQRLDLLHRQLQTPAPTAPALPQPSAPVAVAPISPTPSSATPIESSNIPASESPRFSSPQPRVDAPGSFRSLAIPATAHAATASGSFTPSAGAATPSGNVAASSPANNPATTPDDTTAAIAQQEITKPVADRLEPLPLRAVSAPMPPVRMLLAPATASLIRPHRPARWSLSASAMTVMTRQTIDAAPDDDNNPPGPWHGAPKSAVDEGAKQGTGWRVGLLANYAFNRHWSMVGGAMLRQTSQESTFKPRLRFMDGHHHNGGGGGGPHGPSQYQFTYTGYGGGSESEVTFRVESNSTNSPSPNRPIDVEVATRHTAEYLEIPVGLQFQLPMGRFRPFVRAGAMGNFFLNASASIERLTVNDDDFMAEADFTPSISPEPLTVQSLSAWAATGVQFQLTPRLGLNAEFAWSQQLTGRGNAGTDDPMAHKPPTVTESTLGLGLGLTYSL